MDDKCSKRVWSDGNSGVLRHLHKTTLSPAANNPTNYEFNYCLEKSRLASLQEMWLHLYRRGNMKLFLVWFYSCVILNEILEGLGDQWEEMAPEDVNSLAADAFRKRITLACKKDTSENTASYIQDKSMMLKMVG
ncbi:hypothetical protein VP01_2527g9 [Puccinia sorghi]|uniref:Uncharacterized protein n=1 Tax=Puccinia sorghi TaxID=27349 RepID=A0A0L6V5C4_9BASI|nr:hypothetical protein VP01_2527g9 [Puccinia sorghi]